MKKYISLSLLALLLLSCEREMPEPTCGCDGYANVSFVYDSGNGNSKSSFAFQENQVAELSIWAYDSSTGDLAGYAGFSDGSFLSGTMAMKLLAGRRYSFVFLANCPGVAAPVGWEGVENLRIPACGSQPTANLPMSCRVEDVMVSRDMSLSFTLSKLVSKCRFSIDGSLLKGKLSLLSVCVRQAADDVALSPDSRSISVSDGDRASVADLRSLEKGSSIVLYVPENCRGNLSPGNKTPINKIPYDDKEKKSATYIEVKASYASPTINVDTLTYRMYLGSDNTENYDVRRNKRYDVTLQPSDILIYSGSRNCLWKIDVGEVDIAGSLAFSRNFAFCVCRTEPPYIICRDGTAIRSLPDAVYVGRSDPSLSYMASYDAVAFAESGVNVSYSGDWVIFTPDTLKPKGRQLGFSVYSYDNFLKDSLTVITEPMKLKLKMNPGTGILEMWSENGNPAGIRLKVDIEGVLSYRVEKYRGSIYIGTERKDVPYLAYSEIVPDIVPQDVDSGVLYWLLCVNPQPSMEPSLIHDENGKLTGIRLNINISLVNSEEFGGNMAVDFCGDIFSRMTYDAVPRVGNRPPFLFYAGPYLLGCLDKTDKAGQFYPQYNHLEVYESCNGFEFHDKSGKVWPSAAFVI